MNKGTIHVLIAMSLVGASAFAAKERVIRFQNHVRLGYDSNIYGTADAEGSAFLTDIVNLSGKMNFSSRTDALVYWQPEFQYRFDADPKFITYQDLYGRLNHAMSQRAFLTLSDRFRYQQKEGQTGLVGGGVQDFNQNYIENDLQGAIDYTLSSKNYLKVGGGYEVRVWDDSEYGKGTKNNDYNQLTADGSFIRQFKPNKTQGMAGINYVNNEFAGDRGGYDSVTVLGGVDQNFNKNVTGYGRLGWSFNTVDGKESYDTSSPYLQAGMEVNPTARTSFNGSMGYSMYRSENSVYNAQNRFNVGLGAKHDITAKISLVGSFTYSYSLYKSDYAADVDGTVDVPAGDVDDNYLTLALRCSYQVNRNNFLEAGYLYANRFSDFTDWDRNRVDLGWRLRL
ncbi:hypothetical protein PDESU_04084 [Pontiella desulfatans]|uniref:Outer membrane protein beta-barrel domain-containing protein n=1 Tax=Pontiella desulfatans TaxID=2750659 RepID=A0A6C2U7K3_PONDE|nr:outer membrane beta-barrel protein [Pontiella desulfatans]VGO15501.1 hypothetical protein PDESU_04084 [Pontiella desulfatans]